MTEPPVTAGIPEELARLVHALRQPLGAARLLTDDLGCSRQGADCAVPLDLLSTAIAEAVEVAHALAALAERAAAEAGRPHDRVTDL